MPSSARIFICSVTFSLLAMLSAGTIHAQSLPTFSITSTTPTDNSTAVPVNLWTQRVNFDYSIPTSNACNLNSGTFNQATVILSSPNDSSNYSFFVPQYNPNSTIRNFWVGSTQEGFELKPLTAYTLTLKGGSTGVTITCGSTTYYLDQDTLVRFTTDTDKIPPKILAGTVTAASTSTGAKITWTTSQAATSQVVYGPTTSYGQSSALDATLVTSHSVDLQNLTPGTTYHFKVQSKDAAGNLGSSDDGTFTALNMANITVSGVQGHQVTISWNTNLPTDSFVEYGKTFQYGSLSGSQGSVTQHSVTIVNLDSGVTYHFRIKATTSQGTSYSLDNQFATVYVLGSSVSVPDSGQIFGSSSLNSSKNGTATSSASPSASQLPSVLGASDAATLANWNTSQAPKVQSASMSGPIFAGGQWAWLWVPIILLAGLAGLVGLLWQHHQRLEKRMSDLGGQ